MNGSLTKPASSLLLLHVLEHHPPMSDPDGFALQTRALPQKMSVQPGKRSRI